MIWKITSVGRPTTFGYNFYFSQQNGEAMLLEIDARSSKLDTKAIQDAFDTNSVIILRNAFDPSSMPEFFENVAEFRDVVVKSVEDGTPTEFPPHYVYKANTQSCNLYSMDPGTCKMLEERGEDLEDDSARLMAEYSELVKQITSCATWPLISNILPESPVFQGARMRVVHHKGGQPRDNKGAVALHQEKWVLRGQDVPIGFNMWLLLNPDGGTAGENLPGLQFVLGDTAFWRHPLPDDLEDYKETVRPRVLRLNGLCRRVADDPDEIIEVDGSTVFRPKINVGDIALFNHHIPHGSFVPADASSTRVSCEFRIFPRDRSFTGLKI